MFVKEKLGLSCQGKTVTQLSPTKSILTLVSALPHLERDDFSRHFAGYKAVLQTIRSYSAKLSNICQELLVFVFNCCGEMTA